MSNRVALGTVDGTPRLRVVKPGFNALNTAIALKQVVFDSTWTQTLAIRATGSALFVPKPAGQAQAYSLAAQGYVPLLYGMYYDNQVDRYYPWVSEHVSVTYKDGTLYLFADENYIDANRWYFDYVIFDAKVAN